MNAKHLALFSLIIIQIFCARNFGLDTDYLKKRAQPSLGLGMPVRRINRPNPYATTDTSSDPNPSYVQANKKPQPIVIGGGKPNKGPTGIIDIFEEDERPEPGLGPINRYGNLQGNKVAQGTVEGKDNKKPTGSVIQPNGGVETKKDGPGSKGPSIQPQTPGKQNLMKPFLDFSRAGKNFVMPFGVPTGLLTPDFMFPGTNKDGQQPELGGNGQTKPSLQKDKVIPNPTMLQDKAKLDVVNLEPVEIVPESKKTPQKTFVDEETQTDFGNDEDIITEKDLVQPEGSPDQSKNILDQSGTPKNDQVVPEIHVIDTSGSESPRQPSGGKDKTPTPFDLLSVSSTGAEINEEDDGDVSEEEKDIVEALSKVTRSRSENDILPDHKQPVDNKFMDDTDIDYGNVFLSVNEHEGGLPFDRDYVRKTLRARPSIRISGSRVPLGPSYIRNQPNQKLRKVKRIYLIEVVKCAQCEDDNLISDFVERNF